MSPCDDEFNSIDKSKILFCESLPGSSPCSEILSTIPMPPSGIYGSCTDDGYGNDQQNCIVDNIARLYKFSPSPSPCGGTPRHIPEKDVQNSHCVYNSDIGLYQDMRWKGDTSYLTCGGIRPIPIPPTPPKSSSSSSWIIILIIVIVLAIVFIWIIEFLVYRHMKKKHLTSR